jgi:uncharacterized damage-inducible protein DinB
MLDKSHIWHIITIYTNMEGDVMRGSRSTKTLPTKLVLRRALEEVYRGPAWHGASVLTTLRTIGPAAASRRAAPGRNTVWELVLHLAYTRHRMLLRLSGGAGARFPRPLRTAWWPRMPAAASLEAWRADLELLSDYQDRLLTALARAPRSRLLRRRPGQPNPIGFEMLGVAMHDAYHTGQIRLLLRLGGRS